MPTFARASLSALAVLALATAGCSTGADFGSTSSRSQSSTQTAVSAPDAGGTVNVVMMSLEFIPTAIHARVGQTVRWTNKDGAPHNVTYVSGPRFKSSAPVLSPGDTYSIKLTTPGTIHYFCSIHPWMKATISVSP